MLSQYTYGGALSRTFISRNKETSQHTSDAVLATAISSTSVKYIGFLEDHEFRFAPWKTIYVVVKILPLQLPAQSESEKASNDNGVFFFRTNQNLSPSKIT